MSWEQKLIRVGTHDVSLLDLALMGGSLALFLLILIAILAWRAQSGRHQQALEAMRRTGDLEFRLVDLAGQLRHLTDQSASAQAHMTDTLDQRLDQVNRRLGASLNDQAERTGQSLRQLHERLAVIDSAQRNLAALSGEMISLKDILSNKQARGAYGQGRMEAIIRDGLQSSAYSFQSTLSNGTRPDCLVKLPDSQLHLVIDAKFPLEAFNALKAAKGESEIKAAEARLRRDVGTHVKDIAGKYLIAGETHESAIMFVPSEAVYADLYERFEDVIQKAHRERVVIASPNVLMLLVQTLQAVFKDARMREQAHLIKIEVARLLEDVGRLKDRVLDLNRHFGQAAGDLERLGLSADKITKRGHRIEQLDLAEPLAGDEPQRPRLVGGG
jgi:DNA recombination protein RmuC